MRASTPPRTGVKGRCRRHAATHHLCTGVVASTSTSTGVSTSTGSSVIGSVRAHERARPLASRGELWRHVHLRLWRRVDVQRRAWRCKTSHGHEGDVESMNGAARRNVVSRPCRPVFSTRLHAPTPVARTVGRVVHREPELLAHALLQHLHLAALTCTRGVIHGRAASVTCTSAIHGHTTTAQQSRARRHGRWQQLTVHQDDVLRLDLAHELHDALAVRVAAER